jgi:MFS family permease
VLVALSLIRGGLPERDGPPPPRKGMVTDGLRYVRSRPDLLLILGVMFFVGTFGLNFQLTSALMATEVYGKGAGEYGVIGSIMALGSITGALLSARRQTVSLRLVVVAAVVFGCVEIVISQMPTYFTFVLLTPVIGITALTTITSANTVMQLSLPPELRGRVMALYLMVFMGGTPLGSPLIGWVGETYGARWSLIGGGVMSILGTLFCAALYVRARSRREASAEPERELALPRLVG